MWYHDCVHDGGSRVKNVREGIRFEVFCMGGRYAIWERIIVVAMSLTRPFSRLSHRDRGFLIVSSLKHGAEDSQISSLAYFAVVMDSMRLRSFPHILNALLISIQSYIKASGHTCGMSLSQNFLNVDSSG